MRRESWRDEIRLPPSVNVSSYCYDCNTFTYWKKVDETTLTCTKCTRRVEV